MLCIFVLDLDERINVEYMIFSFLKMEIKILKKQFKEPQNPKDNEMKCTTFKCASLQFLNVYKYNQLMPCVFCQVLHYFDLFFNWKFDYYAHNNHTIISIEIDLVADLCNIFLQKCIMRYVGLSLSISISCKHIDY